MCKNRGRLHINHLRSEASERAVERNNRTELQQLSILAARKVKVPFSSMKDYKKVDVDSDEFKKEGYCKEVVRLVKSIAAGGSNVKASVVEENVEPVVDETDDKPRKKRTSAKELRNKE